MVLIRRSLDLLVRALARLPRGVAVLVGVFVIPVVGSHVRRGRADPRGRREGSIRPASGVQIGAALFVVLAVASSCAGTPAAAVPALAADLASPAAEPTAKVTPSPRATLRPTPRATPAPRPTFGPTGPTVEARVVRVIDGDTIEVEVAGASYNVRYIGMDTPETVDPGSPIEWMGPEAAAVNAELVAGKSVVLESDVSQTDQYGRLLRYVWLTDSVPWTLVNLELVRRGVASIDTWPPDVKYADLILAAEHSARGTSAGLWGATPPPTPVPTLVPFVAPPPEPASDCHPSYTPCLPIVGDLNCPDVRSLGAAPVRVKGSDDYKLDRDGDGIGCE